MSALPTTFAEDVIERPAREQLEVFLDEHRTAMLGCLDGLNEEQARRSLVPSRTTLLGLVKHATFVEQVWFDEAVTCRSRAEIGIPASAEDSFALDDHVLGNRRGPLPLRWVYFHMLRELAQHCGHADIMREQLLAT